MARSVRFERKSSTHHVAFLEKAYVTGWGERRTRLEAVRAVREAEGWRVDVVRVRRPGPRLCVRRGWQSDVLRPTGGLLMPLTHAPERPAKCWGPEPEKHRKGCRLGRPLCRWRRRQAGLCHCEYLPYPHNGRSCKGVPAVILESPSYRRTAA